MNTAIWCLSMSVTLQAAFQLGRDYSMYLRSVKHPSSKSVEQLCRTTGKLIKEQTEIALSSIDWNQPFCDRAVRVFSDSVLCLGGISPEPVQAWKDKIKWYLENRYLKELDRIDGEQMEFEWTISQDSLHREFSMRFRI